MTAMPNTTYARRKPKNPAPPIIRPGETPQLANTRRTRAIVGGSRLGQAVGAAPQGGALAQGQQYSLQTQQPVGRLQSAFQQPNPLQAAHQAQASMFLGRPGNRAAEVARQRAGFRSLQDQVRGEADTGALDLNANLPPDIQQSERRNDLIHRFQPKSSAEMMAASEGDWNEAVRKSRLQQALSTGLGEEADRTASLRPINERAQAEEAQRQQSFQERGRLADAMRAQGERVPGTATVSVGEPGDLMQALARRNARLERQGRDTSGLHAYPNMLAGQPSSQKNETGGFYRGGNLMAPQVEAPAGGEVPPPAPNPELPYQQHLANAGLKGDSRLNRMLMGGYQGRGLNPAQSAGMAMAQRDPNSPLTNLMMGGGRFALGMAGQPSENLLNEAEARFLNAQSGNVNFQNSARNVYLQSRFNGLSHEDAMKAVQMGGDMSMAAPPEEEGGGEAEMTQSDWQALEALNKNRATPITPKLFKERFGAGRRLGRGMLDALNTAGGQFQYSAGM